jgi:hypothetical protein
MTSFRAPTSGAPAWKRFLLLVALTLGAPGCGDDGGVGADADLAAFVGDWSASRFVVKSRANPEIAPDLISALGAEFTVHVEPSGQYTAILVYQSLPITELGTLEVSGNELVFHVTVPTPRITRSRFTFTGTSRVTLVGDTEFDYNFDGTPEPAEATIELIKR